MRPRFPTARAVLATGLALGWLSVASGRQATFRAGAEGVRVDVLVTDKGHPVTGLRGSDFEILDNGVRQDVTLIGTSQLPVNLILALDVSESVVGERLGRLREACAAIVADLGPRDRAGLLTFNHRIALRVPPTTELPRVLDALGTFFGEGATSLRDAAFVSLQVAGGVGDGRSLVVIFSDGVDRSSWLRDDDVVRAGQRTEAMVYAVTVDEEPSPVLEHLTGATGGAVVQAGADRDLRAAFVRVLAEFGSRYLLGYSPRGPEAAGWHTIAVRVPREAYKIQARPGYVHTIRGQR